MIVVLAPYGRNEVSAAAIRLADLALTLGVEVRLVAVCVRERGVHPFWDTHVRSFKNNGLYKAATGASHCVWFVPSKRFVDMARLVAPECRHTLVVSWHSLRKEDVPGLDAFDVLVCPSVACRQLVLEQVYDGHDHAGRRLLTCPWDAGLPYTRHDGQAESGWRGLLFYCDAATIDGCGVQTLQAADQLLQTVDDARVTFSCTKSWGRRDRRVLRDRVAVWQGRLAVVYQRGWVEQIRLIQRHDWLVLPGNRSDFGQAAVRGLACGLPVIAYDVAPCSELVVDGVNGHLAACEVVGNWMQAPTAAPNAVSLLDVILKALDEPEHLRHLQSADWLVDEHGRAFTALWSGLWDLDA